MRIWSLCLIIFGIGCTHTPHSKEYIYTKSNETLSLQGKINTLRKSSELYDDALLSSIAILYAQNRDWHEAKQAISKAIKLNPLEPSYHVHLARFSAQLNNSIEAYNEAKIAFELGEYDAKLEKLIAQMAIETLDTISGSEFVLKYYESNRDDSEAQLLMARLHLIQKEYTLAEQLVQRVLEKDSLNKNGWEVAYLSYLQLDSIDLAISFGNKLIQVDSTNALYLYQVAGLYNSKSDLVNAGRYFATSYMYLPTIEKLQLIIRNYTKLEMYDSVLYYSDSAFAGRNYKNNEVLLLRARAYDKRYKFYESFLVYNELLKMDSTDSIVHAEQEIVQRKIAYLQRKKREQKQLADSLANSMPLLNF